MFLFIYFMVLVVIPIIKTYCTAIFTENNFLPPTLMNYKTWTSEMTRLMMIMMMKLMKINIEVWAHDHPPRGSQPQDLRCN